MRVLFYGGRTSIVRKEIFCKLVILWVFLARQMVRGQDINIMSHPLEQKLAPDFTLPDQDGKMHTLSHHKGSWILLYFYPKDNTTGCTKEACMIRDSFPEFWKLNVKVFGVSTDTVQSHKKFADEYKLPFTLLADIEKKVVNLYGVWAKKKFMGREYDGTLRTSFLIDPHGTIVKVYEGVKPERHADEVIRDLGTLQQFFWIS